MGGNGRNRIQRKKRRNVKMKKRMCMCKKCGYDYLYKNNGALKTFRDSNGKSRTLCADCYEIYMEKQLRKERKMVYA